MERVLPMFFKNKHIITSLIVAPILAPLGYFTICQINKLISDNIWIGLVLWHRLDVYNQKLLIHNKCAWVGIHQWFEKYTKEAFYLLNYLSEINFD